MVFIVGAFVFFFLFFPGGPFFGFAPSPPSHVSLGVMRTALSANFLSVGGEASRGGVGISRRFCLCLESVCMAGGGGGRGWTGWMGTIRSKPLCDVFMYLYGA